MQIPYEIEATSLFLQKWVIWEFWEKVLFENKALYLKRLADPRLQATWHLGKRFVTSASGLWAMPRHETVSGLRTHWH